MTLAHDFFELQRKKDSCASEKQIVKRANVD